MTKYSGILAIWANKVKNTEYFKANSLQLFLSRQSAKLY